MIPFFVSERLGISRTAARFVRGGAAVCHGWAINMKGLKPLSFN
jgi:hypothetical protein